MLANLGRLGYRTMTRHPAGDTAAFALAGKDLIAQAKRAAVRRRPSPSRCGGCCAPDVRRWCSALTRELAEQVTQELRRPACAEDNVKILTLAGGVMMRGQQSLGAWRTSPWARRASIMDLLDRGNLELGAVKTLVLDEAGPHAGHGLSR